jgi:hypothetical protein
LEQQGTFLCDDDVMRMAVWRMMDSLLPHFSVKLMCALLRAVSPAYHERACKRETRHFLELQAIAYQPL